MGGVEGFKFLVNEAMQYIHTRMRILTRAKLYWALVVHRHCSDSFRICFIFVAIHKKICLYSGNFDVNKELSTFIDKMSTHLNEGTQEGLNKYLANCEVIERIFLPFGKGPIQNLLDSLCTNIQYSNRDFSSLKIFLNYSVEFADQFKNTHLVDLVVEVITKIQAQPDILIKTQMFNNISEFLQICCTNNIFDGPCTHEDIGLWINFTFLLLSMEWLQMIQNQFTIFNFDRIYFKVLCKTIQLILLTKDDTKNIYLCDVDPTAITNFRKYFELWVTFVKIKETIPDDELISLLDFNAKPELRIDTKSIFPFFRDALSHIQYYFAPNQTLHSFMTSPNVPLTDYTQNSHSSNAPSTSDSTTNI